MDRHQEGTATELAEVKQLLKELFSYLDYTEITDSGREYKPITISCSRVLMCEPLGNCITKLKEHKGE